ncbi:aliphatic sulfonate ABC transporter substrate-binding protein [Paenibacillus sp. CAA11]|uniref:sulfonate ABC transporter substrate-binding protein n=1 Tax=Paenibacillus sp. CAA11 TaxID=1532905 RepID=UPI000D386C7E|nr:sulfonate ABC transporter substrate-binding protein [Paenibacillus sp. CAA11]AWB43020.1 aliphatic sulfonate ABC transporter substrate-binding protein [Paenibacillus sp. CAA11]
MPTKRYLAVWLSLLLLMTAVLSSCSIGEASKQAKADAKKTVRIGYQKNGPLIILKTRGTLEERLKPLGVTVEWYEFASGPPLLESLNAGSLDLGRTGDSPPIFAQASGSSLVYVAVGKPKSSGSGILVKQGSAIKTIGDLKGKTIGFAKGSSSHYFLVEALAEAGLTPSDIKPAYLSPGDARIAFEQGKIDAWIVWDPFTADAEKAAGARMLVSGEGLTTDRDFFLASEKFAEQHEDLVKIVVEEIQKASDWANAHPAELTKLLSSILGIDEASMQLAVERREYGLDALNEEIIAEQQQIADVFYELKIIPKKVNIAERVYKFKEKDESR